MKKIILWDWDGTLVNSLPYKYEGIWDDIFINNEVAQKTVKEFIQTNEGKRYNRYGLIAYALQQQGLLSENENPNSSELVEKYAERYRYASAQAVPSFGLLPGAEDILSNLFSAGYTMYLVSGGGSDEELKQLLEKLNVDQYFKDIFGYGSVTANSTDFGKYDSFLRVLKKEKYPSPNNFIVIGDSAKDKELAQKIGCDFIGVAHKYNKWLVDHRNIFGNLKDVYSFFSKH